MSNEIKNEVMLATIGVEPQVVTIALDLLLESRHQIAEVIVIYTTDLVVLKALDVIQEEFATNCYPGVALSMVEVKDDKGSVTDFYNPESLQALMNTLYMEVRRLRVSGEKLHFCLTGGRKVMCIMGMVVSQLLFGPDDNVWYLVTEGWKPGTKRKLHISKGDKAWLLPIPVLRWNEAGTLLKVVAELDDPAEVVAWYERLAGESHHKRKGEFVRHWLTPALSKVAQYACKGYDNRAIAKILNKKEQTVANQLGEVYRQLHEWLGFPPTKVGRSILIAEFAPYFAKTHQS